MIDPVSAYAAATAAYKGVKMLINAGREIEDVSKQLGAWYGAVADITRAESQRKNTTWLEKKQHGEASIEQEAMDITIRAKKLKEFEYEIRVMLDYRFGLGTYDQMLGMRRKIRAERERTVYAAMESKRQMANNLAITGLALGIVSVLGGGIYLLTLAL
jgi:threonine synthase